MKPSEEFDVDAFLDQVCKRPGMFVGRINYELVTTFIAGVDWGLRMAEEPFLEGITEWLNLQFGTSPMYWTHRIGDENVSDGERINQLHTVLKQFRAELQSKGIETIRDEHEAKFGRRSSAYGMRSS